MWEFFPIPALPRKKRALLLRVTAGGRLRPLSPEGDLARRDAARPRAAAAGLPEILHRGEAVQHEAPDSQRHRRRSGGSNQPVLLRSPGRQINRLLEMITSTCVQFFTIILEPTLQGAAWSWKRFCYHQIGNFHLPTGLRDNSPPFDGKFPKFDNKTFLTTIRRTLYVSNTFQFYRNFECITNFELMLLICQLPSRRPAAPQRHFTTMSRTDASSGWSGG